MSTIFQARQDNKEALYNIIDNLCMDGETVATMFINYHGTQLLTSGFMEFVKAETGMDEEEQD